MSEFEVGRLFGAIFIAAIPSAIACFMLCTKKWNNPIVAWAGAFLCFASGAIGGFLFCLPMLGITCVVAKFTAPEAGEHLDTNSVQGDVTYMDQIRELNKLKEEGIITDSEFETKKKELLAS